MIYLNSQPIKYKRMQWNKNRQKQLISVNLNLHDKPIIMVIKVELDKKKITVA